MARTSRSSLPALVAGILTLTAAPAAAELVVEARIGPAGAIHGDLPDDLDLDVGLGGGVALGWSMNETLSLFGRYDGIGLPGGGGRVEGFSGDVSIDTDAIGHALTLGPELRSRSDAIEVYAGAFAGLYLTKVEIAGAVDVGIFSISSGGSTDTSSDFGFNTRAGLRWYPTDQLFLGPELAYHFILLQDEVEDEVGVLVGTIGVGLRFE